jgi:zinc protease
MMRRAVVLSLAVAVGSAAAAPFEKSGIADWTTPPVPGPEPTFNPPVPQRLRLDNGVSLLVIENHTLPVIAIRVIVAGAGAAADPQNRSGLAAFTADLVDEGAGGLSALAVSGAQERIGSRISTWVDADAAWIAVTALARRLDPTLDLLAKIVTQPALDPSELARVKGDRVTDIEQRRDRPPEVAENVLVEALFGPGSAYGHPIAGVRDDVNAVTAAEVEAFYRAHWAPAAMTIVVVGDVDPTRFKAKLDAVLGGWRPGATSAPAGAATSGAAAATPRPRSAKPARLLLVDRPGAVQSDVRIGRIGPDRKDKRYYAFEVLRTALGGGFTGRITQRLREQLGIIYHGYATMDWRVAPGPFVIDAAIETSKTATGISEVIKMLDDLASQDVPPAELDKAKQNLVRALPAMFQTNGATASAFADLALHRLPDDWYAQFADGIRKVTAADVKAAARAMLPSGSMAVSIVGDIAKIQPALDKLGLGAPARYDLDGRRVTAAPAR